MIFTIGYEKLSRDDFDRIIKLLQSNDNTIKIIDVRAYPNTKFSKADSPNSFSGVALSKAYPDLYEHHAELGGTAAEPYDTPETDFLETNYESLKNHHLLLCKEHNAIDCHRHHLITKGLFDDAIHIIKIGNNSFGCYADIDLEDILSADIETSADKIISLNDFIEALAKSIQ